MPDTGNTRFTMRTLREYLEEQCYRKDVYRIGPGWEDCGRCTCLIQTDGGFEVFEAESGGVEVFLAGGGAVRARTILVDEDEAVACAKLLEMLDHDYWAQAHAISCTPEENEIEEAERALAALSIRTDRSDIMDFSWDVEVLHRLYVFGRDLHTIEQLVASGELDLPRYYSPKIPVPRRSRSSQGEADSDPPGS